MRVALAYDTATDRYDLGPGHPLKAARVTLSVQLMRAYELLMDADMPLVPDEGVASDEPIGRAFVVVPECAADSELELVHDAAYVAAVKEASRTGAPPAPRYGLGPGDNPVIEGIHEVSALICGGTILAVRSVLEGHCARAFAVAGGLHHAHRARAAGFCVYNDPAVAIAHARRDDPALRVMYLDIDGHHGDGVQEAFYDSADVLTLSIHETGVYLFPGGGFEEETGAGDGVGYSLNVPLPPGATDDCYRLVFDEIVEPAARAYRPDLIVAQCGADAHHSDPLTHLGVTLPGYRDLYRRIVALSDDLCGGRLVATGGGGYAWYSAVPRAWTCLMATLLGVELPQQLPDVWRERVEVLSGSDAPLRLSDDDVCETPTEARDRMLFATWHTIGELRRHVPLLGG